jgi:flavin reductase (DIM6/NTAB) family NADH-FMN oxidoreductase RutF
MPAMLNGEGRRNMTAGGIRTALTRLPYGVYILGVTVNGKSRFILATWVMQVSFNPVQLVVAIENGSTTSLEVLHTKRFSINLLTHGNASTAKPFLKSPTAVPGDEGPLSHRLSALGSPFLMKASASLDCHVVQVVPTGDHSLFIVEIDEVVNHDKEPILTLQETGWTYWKTQKETK